MGDKKSYNFNLKIGLSNKLDRIIVNLKEKGIYKDRSQIICELLENLNEDYFINDSPKHELKKEITTEKTKLNKNSFMNLGGNL